ncbi:hypothetical protein L4C33_08330 [Vibrio makurazakiensis]|uniref:hypothetical protein n=1 Tax=Vibrio makurazakiensis TaxID=2910250 RepID=UPI003D0BC434
MNYKKKLKVAAICILSTSCIMAISVGAKYFIFERPKVIAEQKEEERKILLKTSLRKKADKSIEENILKFCERPDSKNSIRLFTYWLYGHHQQFPGWKTLESSCTDGTCDAKLSLSESVNDKISAVNAIQYILNKMKDDSSGLNDFKYSFNKGFDEVLINNFNIESELDLNIDEQCGTVIPYSKDVSLLTEQLYGIVELYKKNEILIEVKEHRHISYAHQKMVKLDELSQNLYVQELDIYAGDLEELRSFINTLNELSPWSWNLYGFEYPIKAKKAFTGYKMTLFMLVKK